MTQAAMPTEEGTEEGEEGEGREEGKEGEGREEGEEGKGRVEVTAHSLVMCVWSHCSGEPVDIGHVCGVVG